METENLFKQLKRIADSLENIEQSLILMSDIISDCQVKHTYGSAIAITGSIDTGID